MGNNYYRIIEFEALNLCVKVYNIYYENNQRYMIIIHTKILYDIRKYKAI